MAKVKVKVLAEFCKGCGLCVSFCPRNALHLCEEVNDRGVHIVLVRDDVECTGCGNCATMCPDAAIVIEERVEA